jgi:hypothetical protein
MVQPPAFRQCPQSGPAGFLSSAISSAEQHIVQAPQAFPGAAAMKSLLVVPVANRADFLCKCLSSLAHESEAFGRRRTDLRTPRHMTLS